MTGGLRKTIAPLRVRLNRTLFVEPERPVPGGLSGRVLVIAGLLILAILLQILRLGWENSVHALWAEDGQIFLYGALTHDFLHDAFATYAGYLVLVPRLIGELAGAFPLSDAPAVVAVASGAIVGLCGLAVWHGSAGLITNPLLRGVLVATTVLVPVGGLESVASGAYVPWFLLFATFWLLFWRPATTSGAGLGGALILATGLSTPGVWFFAPVAVLRAIAARDRRDAIVLGCFALGAAVQVPVIVLNHESSVTPRWTDAIWTDYLQRALDGAAFGLRLGGGAWSQFGWPFLIALLVCCVVALAVFVRRAGSAGLYFAAIAVPTSVAMFAVSLYQRAVGTLMLWPAGLHTGGGGRYAIVPALLLVSLALVVVDRAARRPSARTGLAWPGLALAALLLLSVASSYDVANSEGRGTPRWSESLRKAAATCRTEPAGAEVLVPTSPPPWGVPVSCDRLASYAGPASRR
jgi:hypothetical protein